jgi:hypothetical protein
LVLPQNSSDLVTNLDPGLEDDEIAISRCLAPCDCNLDKYVGKTIGVVAVVINMGSFEKDNSPGELEDKAYFSMLLDDDTVVGGAGKVVVKQLGFAVGAGRGGRFNPVKFYEVREHPMPKPKQPYYSLRRVNPPKAAQAGKGGGK